MPRPETALMLAVICTMLALTLWVSREVPYRYTHGPDPACSTYYDH